jgi:peptidyl-prolyl cis-trans isomerase B (cyclophilin B)
MSDVTPPPAAAPYAAAPTGPKTNTLAIVSLVLAFFISLGAVICGHIALSQIKKTGENGRGLAIAGLVLGYLGLVAGLIGTIIWISFFAIAASSGGFSY